MQLRHALVVSLALLVPLAGCGPASDRGGGGDGGGAVTALRIEPQDPSTTAVNGVAPTIALSAIATFADGTERTLDLDEASWALGDSRLGAISSDSGKFQASGQLAGTSPVTAAAFGVTATTSVTVRIEDLHVGPGVPPDVADRFTAAPVLGSPQSPVLLYPLHLALVPSTLKAPDVQWDLGAAGDLYRVTLTAGLARTTAYLVHDGAPFRYAWPVDGASWAALKASTTAAGVTFTVDRWAAADATVYGSATHSVEVAAANVAGAIYYWDLSEGRIQRITASGRESFMPNPPPRPADGRRCVGCHTVSRDGRYMAGQLWDGGDFGAIFDLSLDLAADPAPTVVPPDRYKTLFATFNPDATRLLINRDTGLFLVDATTGAALPALGNGLPATGTAHPTWSPDGATVAYIANHNGGWAVDFDVGDLAVLPVTAPDTFGAPQVIRIAEGLANSWPTFSPDSSWIAFGRGSNSRGRNGDTQYPGSLWLIPRTGGAPTELANANGGAGAMNSYLPSFSPFTEGGHFWMAFYSTRDYGNAYAGTRGTGRRQIWVTAISTTITPGQDPSRVGFWLPDQDVATHNMSAYWAPAPPLQ